MATPRLVIVHRRTELQELLDRHATRGQAEFFLRTRAAHWVRSNSATTVCARNWPWSAPV